MFHFSHSEQYGKYIFLEHFNGSAGHFEENEPQNIFCNLKIILNYQGYPSDDTILSNFLKYLWCVMKSIKMAKAT